VIVSRDLTKRGVSSLLVDNEAGGILAMRHLVELGHRRIAVIRGPEELFDSAPRWAGVQQAAAKAGIKLDKELVLQLPSLVDPASGFEGGLDCARRMLASGKPFTAVLAFDDLTALGVVRGLTEAGLRVPEDCSVLGFDDVLPAAVATPGITTIRQPLKEMGLLAAEWRHWRNGSTEALKSQNCTKRSRSWCGGCRLPARRRREEKTGKRGRTLDKAEQDGEYLHYSND
jgi:LacI family transcriptional regulator